MPCASHRHPLLLCATSSKPVIVLKRYYHTVKHDYIGSICLDIPTQGLGLGLRKWFYPLAATTGHNESRGGEWPAHGICGPRTRVALCGWTFEYSSISQDIVD